MTRLIPLFPFGRLDNVLFRSRVGFAAQEPEWDEILSQIDNGGDVAFPSHFFEHPRRAELAELARKRDRQLSLQISPGAELLDFYDELLALGPLRIELFMDRCPHARDLEKIRSLENLGYEVHPVLVPMRGALLAETLERLPDSMRKKLRFYFPKTDSSASALKADEIFVLLSELTKRFPDLAPKPHSYLRDFEPSGDESAAQSEFRHSLNLEYYRENFSGMGNYPQLRRALIGIQKFKVSSLVLSTTLFVLGAFAHPIHALIRVRNRSIALSRFLNRVFYYRFCRAFLYPILFRAWSEARGIAKHPIGSLQKYLPPAYWLFIWPIRKIYWFTQYQVQTRLLTRR